MQLPYFKQILELVKTKVKEDFDMVPLMKCFASVYQHMKWMDEDTHYLMTKWPKLEKEVMDRSSLGNYAYPNQKAFELIHHSSSNKNGAKKQSLELKLNYRIYFRHTLNPEVATAYQLKMSTIDEFTRRFRKFEPDFILSISDVGDPFKQKMH